MKNYQDFCNNVSNQLFDIIDTHGGLLEWQKCWNVNGSTKLPMGNNGFYQGINLFSLLKLQLEQGYSSSEWLTYLQVQKQGGSVLKGAKGTLVYFWTVKPIKADESGEKNKDEINQKKEKIIFKTYTVFNLDQTSLKQNNKTCEISSNLLPNIKTLVNILKVEISHFGNQPYYNKQDDCIVMPNFENFHTQADYYTTLLHEIVHWTGATCRLNRDSLKNHSAKLSRAEEELIAEIGSMFLASYFGITGKLINHASYIAAWKKSLSSAAIARAINHASKAFTWIIEKLEHNAK